MKISQVIAMLEDSLKVHGDIEVYIDMDFYGERPVRVDKGPLLPSPDYQNGAGDLPERIVI